MTRYFFSLRAQWLVGALVLMLWNSAMAVPREHIVIRVSEQLLYLYDGQKLLAVYPVSTSKYGTGNTIGSKKTPLGLHYIVEKIGVGAPLYTVFEKRRATDRIQPPMAANRGALITSRILRLQGLEKGVNLGKNVDTLSRGIYIHGTSAEETIGQPASHGCIRMRNEEMVELFEAVSRLTRVRLEP
jgi:lipoprotein-anchoring transpeptidase ErfK/SrfK